ncbi:hypothetical protein N752_13235 [Desulforamulus aquiferis]|nr:hypothetical protein [Desulforamulus aquiferis]RYD04331.1 hypothetical protein N752_13235 [Desulforamulus aquiferis]
MGIQGNRVVSQLGAPQVIIHQLIMPDMPTKELTKAANWEAQKLLSVPVSEAEVRP